MKNPDAYIWVCIIAIISIFIEEHRQRPCVTQDGTMRVFDTYTNIVFTEWRRLILASVFIPGYRAPIQ